MDQRTDRLVAVQVDLAVNIAAVYGMAAGVVSLHECGAPLAVIQRVLIQGEPRRGHAALDSSIGEVEQTLYPQKWT